MDESQQLEPTANPGTANAAAADQNEPSKQEVTKCLMGSVFFATLGTSFLFGYNIGVLNNLEQPITDHIKDHWDMHNSSKESISFAFSSVQSVWTGFGMVGAFTTGLVLKVGRKRAILANCLTMIVGIVFESVTGIAKEPALLYLGRAIVGFACGLNVSLVNVYLPEISFKRVRGSVSACHQLQTTFGILVAQLMTLSPLFGNASYWPQAFAVSCLCAVITLIALPFFPDSPRYLLLTKKDREGAVKALERLRGTTCVEEEIREMEIEQEEMNKVEAFTLKQLFVSKTFRYSLIIVIVMQMAQQFSGINFVFFYSGKMFESTGLGSNAQYAVLSTGIINFLATFLALYLIEKLGRRPLLIYPLIVMAIACVALVVTLQFASVAVLNIVLTCIYIIGFAVGLGPIPPFVASEVFTQEPRPAAMTVGTFVNFTCTLIVALISPFLRDSMGSYVFLVFLVFIILSIAFVVIVVPETKNRTFDDIFQQLSKFGRKGSLTQNVPTDVENKEKLTDGVEGTPQQDGITKAAVNAPQPQASTPAPAPEAQVAKEPTPTTPVMPIPAAPEPVSEPVASNSPTKEQEQLAADSLESAQTEASSLLPGQTDIAADSEETMA